MKNQLPNVIFITDVIDNFDHYSDNCGFVPIYIIIIIIIIIIIGKEKEKRKWKLWVSLGV